MTLCGGFTVFEPMAQGAPTYPFEDIQAKANQIPEERKIHLEQKTKESKRNETPKSPLEEAKADLVRDGFMGQSL
jgi:hypothetical protein